MTKHMDHEVRRPAVAKLAAKLQAAGMPLNEAATKAKATITAGKPGRVAQSRGARPAPTGGAMFIHGPQGCGKTRNAAALCKFFGKRAAVDYDVTRTSYAGNLIVFSNEPLPGSMPFRTAMSRAGIKA
ncbi:hypothetical protein ACEN9F_13510 [Duganella sp. CT11-25]|uniref:hypothetical protein n=1 Tax=unclassified Duganella TaxID=2636909 RepID=UPI0039B0C6A2